MDDNETHMEKWRAQTFDSYQVLVDLGVPALVAARKAEQAQLQTAK